MEAADEEGWDAIKLLVMQAGGASAVREGRWLRECLDGVLGMLLAAWVLVGSQSRIEGNTK